ncbi:MAG: hypothetical protein OQJ91_13890 [Motiliproteus sp.]|nr:hypothetical protein [Motiliproteus sp.]
MFGCELDGVEVYPSVQFQEDQLDPAVVPLGHLMQRQCPLARVRYLLSQLPVGDEDGRFKECVRVLDLLRQGRSRYVFDEARLTFDIRK